MGKKASTITLSTDDRLYLEAQTRARTIQAQTVNRARILLLKADGISIDDIADKVGMNRKSVMLCINKYLKGGVENALFDAPGRGRNAEITDDEKAWIINIACQKPVNLGYSAEVWTRALLTKHINKFAEEAGHTRLSTISQSKVRTILEEADIKPNKITYYCENRDPDFERKMHNVLLVYKQLSLQFDEKGQLISFKENEQAVHVLSYDEKPGIQAIANTSEVIITELEKRKCLIEIYKEKMQENFVDNDYISCQANGKVHSLSAMNIALKKLCVRNGLPAITVHGLRHMFATILVEQSVPLAKISGLLGHSSVNTTFEYYCDVMDEKEKIIAFMNDTFTPEGREGTG